MIPRNKIVSLVLFLALVSTLLCVNPAFSSEKTPTNECEISETHLVKNLKDFLEVSVAINKLEPQNRSEVILFLLTLRTVGVVSSERSFSLVETIRNHNAFCRDGGAHNLTPFLDISLTHARNIQGGIPDLLKKLENAMAFQYAYKYANLFKIQKKLLMEQNAIINTLVEEISLKNGQL